MNQPIGIIAVIIGAVLLGFGYHYSQAPLDQVAETLTGRYTNHTMWYVMGGVALMASGGLLAMFGRRV